MRKNTERHQPWRAYYTFVALPLVRSIIDCLYNITVMLDDPRTKPAEFRRSGYRLALEALQEDETKYAAKPDPNWAEWFRKRRDSIDLGIRRGGSILADVMAQEKWPLLGAYLRAKKGVPLTDHQLFLKNLTFGYWREYSEYSHGTFQGLMRTARSYLEHNLLHEERPRLEQESLTLIFGHITRASAILLCILTELQAYFRFDGARINDRLLQIWSALLGAPEVRDLFGPRYAKLMRDKGINE